MVRSYARHRNTGFSRLVLRVAIDEAEDILDTQPYVMGYETEKQARQVRGGLSKIGIKTEVYADVGPPAKPRSALEEREMRALGAEPGTSYIRWGVRKVKKTN